MGYKEKARFKIGVPLHRYETNSRIFDTIENQETLAL